MAERLDPRAPARRGARPATLRRPPPSPRPIGPDPGRERRADEERRIAALVCAVIAAAIVLVAAQALAPPFGS